MRHARSSLTGILISGGALALLLCLLPACGVTPNEGIPRPTGAAVAPGVVRVDGGQIRGSRQAGLSVYKGIPFAAPPVGDLRWRPPQPVRPWVGVRDCFSFGPAAVQQELPGLGGAVTGPQSEDCLYLNVWSPATEPSRRLPVMVWIHGGGFVSGTADLGLQSAASLCRRGDVVLVSVTYRLGVFGYFALPSLSQESPQHVSGNYGTLDQIAALRWVRRNIAAFGGDPRRVTIFGESAGGQSVLSLLVSPLSRGLFARAISESPRYEDEGIGIWATRPLAGQMAEDGAIATALGAPAGPGQLAALRRVSAARLLLAAAPAPRSIVDYFSSAPHPSFQPVIDGYVLPKEPWEMLAAGDWARVPVMVGSNRDEANSWFRKAPPAAAAQGAAQCRQEVARYAGPLYPQLAKQFPVAGLGGLVPATSRMMTVLEFNAPARFVAQSVARSGLPAYLYYFSWAPPGDPWGATHGSILRYQFDLRPTTTGAAGLAEERLTRQIQSYWTHFAATGDPGVPGEPAWPRYVPRQDRLLALGAHVGAAPAPYARACDIAGAINRKHGAR
jgi:para-nitrobenzyl esterase